MNKPILFNTEMVQAILEGRKTVTRRIVKFPEGMTGRLPENQAEEPILFYPCGIKRPQYKTGDVLWVRETFNSDWCDHTIYKADGGSAKSAGYSKEPKWHPSIHMPREAARIFLKVKSVQAERLNEITVEDALSEGVALHGLYNEQCYAGGCYNGDFETSCKVCKVPINGFESLWNSTIKPADLDRYGWDANPRVWVISFERTEKPEDFV